ncbi:MAG: hypothetical protein CMN32_00210 [Saprospirales bacterium]|nr:hypothetical protein [Saprospirales bacterium]
MLSRYLIAPLIFVALIFLYLAWEDDSSWSYYLIPCILGAAVIYVFSPQIDWWWYQHRPPDLPPGLRKMLEAKLPYYRRLPEPLQQRFRQRMAMYMHAHEFKAQGMESMPIDLQAIIAATAVQVSFGQEDFLMEPYEHIIVYPHPFPSPQFPEKWHTCEIYDEDGVILFSAEQLMISFMDPQKHFHIGLYEYARVFRRCHSEMSWPAWAEEDWPKLEQVSGMKLSYLRKWIGLPDLDIGAVAVAHFFVFPERFKAVFPERYEMFIRNFYRRTPPAAEASVQ